MDRHIDTSTDYTQLTGEHQYLDTDVTQLTDETYIMYHKDLRAYINKKCTFKPETILIIYKLGNIHEYSIIGPIYVKRY